jgi:electron transfer flavoprotein alpha subunit
MAAIAPPRIDPRRPALRTPAGLRRIVLGSRDGERLQQRTVPAHEAPRPVRSAGPFGRCIVAVAQADRGTLDDHAREVIAAAALLAGPDCEVVAAVLGACHDDAATLGIDCLLAWSDFDPGAYQPERVVGWLQQLQQHWRPTAWLLPDRDDDGELGRRFAMASGLGLACHVVELDAQHLRQRADAREDVLRPHAQVMLLARHVARVDLPFTGLGLRAGLNGPAAAAPAPALPPGVEDLGVQAGDPQTLALEEADLIVAAGNGVTDLDTFHALARAVGAATGASRVAVDDGRFPRSQQIGATGKTVAASGYIALGISGAVQHLQGIKDCRHVIAVNLDAAAPIARRANLVVVEDSGRLMQALLGLVRQGREGAAP